MSSALSQQMNMNNFLSLLLGASLVAANSSPTNDAVSHTATSDFPSGVTTFTLPNEPLPVDSSTLATFNYSYENGLGEEVLVNDKDKAKYGEGRILNVTGLLIHITSAINGNDHTGCEKFWNGTNGGPLPTHDIPWIALIKRGRCNFEDKVKHAYWYRAIGVIIYNDKEAPTLDKMKINDKERNITAVFTYKYKGEELAKLVEEGHNVILSIIEGKTHYRSITNINRTSVLFVSISFIVLMIISLVWLVFYYVQRFRYLQTKDKQSRRLCNVAKRIIAKIPTKSIKSDDKEIDNDCCAICIEPYKVTDLIRVLPCRHEFHKACIDPWLLEHRTCPMCKMDILKHYGFVVGSSAKPSSSSSQTQTNPIIVDLYNATSTPPNNLSTLNSNSSSSSTSSSTISNRTASTDSSLSPHNNPGPPSNDDNVMIININSHYDTSLSSSAAISSSSDQSLSDGRRITDV